MDRIEVVSYCGTAHRAAYRPMRSESGIAIEKIRRALEEEEVDLYTGDGGVETALELFMDLLRHDSNDILFIRDIIPHLLLRLDQEQECYDFLKWWAVANDSGDSSLPFLSIHGANMLEPVDIFGPKETSSLSHLVALTLLKMRLHLDFSAYSHPDDMFDDPFEFGRTSELDDSVDRSVGAFARAKVKQMNLNKISDTADGLMAQYQRLCEKVHEANPYFWDTLVDGEPCSPPASYLPGSIEEAQLVVYQCRCAWKDSEDAMVMVLSDVSKFTPVYKGPESGAAGAGNAQLHKLNRGPGLLERRKGTGRVFPTEFQPPQRPPGSVVNPLAVFPATADNKVYRFIHRDDPHKALVYTDGACLNNGQQNPQAGWAVVAGLDTLVDATNRSLASGPLEKKGPFGNESAATSNRAELRAIIAALRLWDWRQEGFDGLVIATDSSYVVDGATAWTRGWLRNGWKTRTGHFVKNRDLWEFLLGEVERWKDEGLSVQLWKIPREQNTTADKVAKRAAAAAAANVAGDDYSEFCGSMSMLDVLNQRSDQRSDQRNNNRLMAAAGPHRVVILCLDYASVVDSTIRDMIASVGSRATLERATTLDAAMSMLAPQQPPPSAILIADAAPACLRKLWERVIDHMYMGTTVVLAGGFSSMANIGQFQRLFLRVGFPWIVSAYSRKTVKLRRDTVDPRLASRLPTAYSQKANFLEHVDRSAVWYAEHETSTKAAVVFAPVGRGKLGYIGDVNGEKGSTAVIMAMCGFLDD